MSESSKDKTKRKLLNYYKNYLWEHKVSLFPQVSPDENEKEVLINIIPNGINQFKHNLARSFTDVAFLIEVRRHYNRWTNINQIIMVMLCSKKIDYEKIQKIADKAFLEGRVKLIDKEVTDKELLKNYNSIKSQKLHNVERLLGRKIRRYNIVNKSQLRERNIPLVDIN